MRSGEEKPKSGDQIGEWCDEIAKYGDGSKGKQFYGIACKSYLLCVYDNNEQLRKKILRCKGISLNSSTAMKLDTQTVKNVLVDGSKIHLPQLRFCKNLAQRSIEVKQIVKKFRRTEGKRVTIEGDPSMRSFPFGCRFLPHYENSSPMF